MLAVALPGLIFLPTPATVHEHAVQYGRAYAHVADVLGDEAAGCKLIGPLSNCGDPTPSDASIVAATGTLRKKIAAHLARAKPKPRAPAPKPAPPPPPMTGPVVASYYDLTGTTSCGQPDAQVGLAFASLFLPCGAQVQMCYGQTCVTATMDDHGPYVAGRTFDLNVALKDALGCPDLCDVTYREL